MDKYKCSYCGVEESKTEFIFEICVSSIYVCEKDICRLKLAEECIDGKISYIDYKEAKSEDYDGKKFKNKYL